MNEKQLIKQNNQLRNILIFMFLSVVLIWVWIDYIELVRVNSVNLNDLNNYGIAHNYHTNKPLLNERDNFIDPSWLLEQRDNIRMIEPTHILKPDV